jgi:hypothetical protein
MKSTVTNDKLRTIGEYILTGMTEKEACTLSDVSYEILQDIKEINENVRSFIEKKIIKFKYNHLKEIQKKRSEKNSQWILEKLRSEEFGSRLRQQDAPTVNVISQIVQQIQHENEPIIHAINSESLPVSGEQPNKEGESPRERVTKILN